eukprot:g5099.t1
MPAPCRKDRSRLDGFEVELFQLVRQHATENQWMKWLRVPLEHAAAKGDMDLFTRLLDAGADGSAGSRGCHGRTLLGAAVEGKSTEMVMALLERGATADVHVTFGVKQDSPLHVAAMRGTGDVCDVLILAAGADTNMVNQDKNSPLHLAAEAGNDDALIALLLGGADPGARNKWAKWTPLHLAAAAGHAQCINTLICSNDVDKDSRDAFSQTPLHLAAQHNRLAAVEKLLAVGAKHHIRLNRSGSPPYYTALDMAAQRGHVDVTRALLRGGSLVNATDKEGSAALHLAAHVDSDLGRHNDNDNGGVIRALIEAGADTETRIRDSGNTPLHHAAFTDSNGNNVRALLEGGANVNASGRDGNTPLHAACGHARRSAVELLLRWGADERLVDKSGRTAEDAVGEWAQYGGLDEYDDERRADDELICRMLARAPADRSWRRRRWLVLARSCPNKVALTEEGSSDDGGGGGGGTGCDAGQGGSGAQDQTGIELGRVVGALVGLNEEGTFRSVVGFL